MKHLFFFIFLMLPFCASAEITLVNGIYYIFEGNDAMVTSGIEKYSGDIIIPAKVEYENKEYNVTTIGDKAFMDGTITSVFLPNSIKDIGKEAFYNCGYLTSVNIPNSVTTIGEKSFAWCTNLTSVFIPNSVANLGSYAFSGCIRLCAANIPNSISTINNGVFDECSSLTAITIPSSVTDINDNAFLKCSSLNSIIIPNSVRSIGSGSFEFCSSLTSITIPNSVTNIGRSAFEGCSSLTAITLPNRLTRIENRSFYNCQSLSAISLPSGVTTIGEDAFGRCGSLTSITVPNSVITIESRAFAACSSLKTITIPSSVNSIGDGAFSWSPSIETVFCYAINIPGIVNNAFEESNVEQATLYVPEESVSGYQHAEVWKSFGQIKGMKAADATNTCSIPAISYSNGYISFNCETEGVEFVSEITNDDIKMHYDSEIALGVTYIISVYATKSGYINSETAHATLCWIDADPQQTGTTDNGQQITANPVLVKSVSGSIIVEGASTDYVEFYNLSGKYLGSDNVVNGRATLNTEEDFVIVRIGDKSVKIKR